MSLVDVPVDHVARQQSPSTIPLPEVLYSTKVITYNKELSDSIELVFCNIIGIDTQAGESLSKLHETKRGKEIVKRRGSEERCGRLTWYNKNWTALTKPDATDKIGKRLSNAFQIVYKRFLREIVAPDLNEDDYLVYQEWPTFRVHLPGTGKPIGRRHRDFDYLHPANEINYWLPVGCTTYQSNSLYVETAPDKGDYTPLTTTSFNQVVRFYGNLLDHFTIPNTTTTTRISIDMRIVRSCDYDPMASERFRVGRYYRKLILKDLIYSISDQSDNDDEQNHEDDEEALDLPELFD